MSKLTILRTAAGSAASPSQIEAFRSQGVRVVAADCDPLSVGFHFADAYRVIPRVDSPEYPPAMIALCRDEHVDAVVPALDEELLILRAHKDDFAAIGTRVLLSPRGALEICTDKWLVFQVFHGRGIPSPETWHGIDQFDVDDICVARVGPLVIKPLRGRGSAGVRPAVTEEDLRRIASECPNDYVIQRQLCGQEYTIDILADWNGEPLVAVPRKRLATESGLSFKAQIDMRPDLIEWAGKISRALPLVGPANIQCFVEPDGQVFFTEVNARLAGSAILTHEAGVPLFAGIVQMCKGETPERWAGFADTDFARWQSSRIMLRSYRETYVSPNVESQSNITLNRQWPNAERWR